MTKSCCRCSSLAVTNPGRGGHVAGAVPNVKVKRDPGVTNPGRGGHVAGGVSNVKVERDPGVTNPGHGGHVAGAVPKIEQVTKSAQKPSARKRPRQQTNSPVTPGCNCCPDDPYNSDYYDE